MLHTVQLNPADFHQKYREAVKIKLERELLDKYNVKLGKIISIKVNDSDIFDNPTLLTHYGVAQFRVQFEATIERFMKDEITLGYLTEI